MTHEEVLDRLVKVIKEAADRGLPLAGSLRRMVSELAEQPQERQAVVLSVLGVSFEAASLKEGGCSNLLFSIAVLLTVGEESLAGCLLRDPVEVAMHRLSTNARLTGGPGSAAGSKTRETGSEAEPWCMETATDGPAQTPRS